MRLVLAGALATLAFAGVAATQPAEARVSFGITINAGDVQFAYRDGYWDRFHRWHPWADPDDWRWYRRHYAARYYDWAHDRDPDMGWRIAVVGPPAGLSFVVGDVMYAYRDGYWDRLHRWHPWATRAEWFWWRNHYPGRYWDWRHDRDPDMGWHVVGGPMMGGVAVGVPGFEVAVGDIRFAYRDGYWDRWHRWHVWHNEAERVWWVNNHREAYWDWHHDRDRDMGWRRDWH